MRSVLIIVTLADIGQVPTRCSGCCASCSTTASPSALSPTTANINKHLKLKRQDDLFYRTMGEGCGKSAAVKIPAASAGRITALVFKQFNAATLGLDDSALRMLLAHASWRWIELRSLRAVMAIIASGNGKAQTACCRFAPLLHRAPSHSRRRGRQWSADSGDVDHRCRTMLTTALVLTKRMSDPASGRSRPRRTSGETRGRPSKYA